MNRIEAESILVEVIADVVFGRGFEFYEVLGISPESFPPSKARRLLESFKATEKAKTREFAKMQFAKALEQDGPSYQLPVEEYELKQAVNAAIALVSSEELIAKLRKSPSDYSKILEESKLENSKPLNEFCLQELMENEFVAQEKAKEKSQAFISLPDWPKLSAAIGGFNPGRVTLLLGKSGQGKTTLAVAFAKSMATISPVYFINMEMTKRDIIGKFLQADAEMTYSEWAKQKIVNYEKLQDAFDNLHSKHKIFITEGRNLTRGQIIASVVKKINEDKVQFVIVDYDQKIISPSYSEEWSYLLETIQMLEDLAKERGIHIILLSQANDDGEPKASRRMKQTAAVQMFFFQDERGNYYIKLVKNRFGITGECVSVNFIGSISHCSEIERFPNGIDGDGWGKPKRKTLDPTTMFKS